MNPQGTPASIPVSDGSESARIAGLTLTRKRAPKCFGSTFDGNYTWRCERRTRNGNGYCHQHQYQAPRGR